MKSTRARQQASPPSSDDDVVIVQRPKPSFYSATPIKPRTQPPTRPPQDVIYAHKKRNPALVAASASKPAGRPIHPPAVLASSSQSVRPITTRSGGRAAVDASEPPSKRRRIGTLDLHVPVWTGRPRNVSGTSVASSDPITRDATASASMEGVEAGPSEVAQGKMVSVGGLGTPPSLASRKRAADDMTTKAGYESSASSTDGEAEVRRQLLQQKAKKATLPTPTKSSEGKKAYPISPSSTPPVARSSGTAVRSSFRSSPVPSPSKSTRRISSILPSAFETSAEDDSSDDELAFVAPRSPTRPTPVHPTPVVPNDSEEDEDMEDTANIASQDELDFLPPRRSPKTTTPLRSSNRARGLPASQASVNQMPTYLHIDAVGWHGEDRSSSPTPSRESSRSVSPELVVLSAACATSSSAHLDPPHQSSEPLSYPIRLVQDLLMHVGGVLTGQRLPSPTSDREASEFDRSDVTAHPYLFGYEEWERPMRYAMKSVVEDGVGNCLIVLGPRGVGKTMIVERSLELMEKVHGVGSFVPVRLNGLVHTTDRLALRAIARQLKSQGYDEEEGDWGSNAATMATLLRMLEPTEDASAEVNKAIILIVDEFDLFALHPRQSFLYCLLDLVQGNRRKTGMGVIGLSSRVDCLSILEKRVRSRCQSQVHQMVLPNSLSDYLKRAESLLRTNTQFWQARGERQAELAVEWNAEVKTFIADPEVVRHFEDLFKLHGSTPTHLLQALAEVYYQLDWNVRHDSSASSDWASPPPDFTTVPRLHIGLLPALPSSAKRDDLLNQLSVLELTVCVTAKHVRNTHDDGMNLEMLYSCYKDHLRRKGAVVAKSHSKAAFAMALDTLREREVFLPVSGKVQGHYFVPSLADGFRMLRFVPWTQAVDEVVKERKDVPEPVRRWNNNWRE